MRPTKLIRKALPYVLFLGFCVLGACVTPHVNAHCILILAVTLGGYWLYRRYERTRDFTSDIKE